MLSGERIEGIFLLTFYVYTKIYANILHNNMVYGII